MVFFFPIDVILRFAPRHWSDKRFTVFDNYEIFICMYHQLNEINVNYMQFVLYICILHRFYIRFFQLYRNEIS